jgi:hypothetical protein
VTEPHPEPYQPQLEQEPRDPARESAYENNLFGLALFAAFLVLFGGSFLVALAYLALD